MTARKQTSLGIQRGPSALSQWQLLGWGWALCVLGWSCSLTQLTGAARDLAEIPQHGPWRNVKNVNKTAYDTARCPSKEPLILEQNSPRCISVEDCRHNYAVHWIKRWCLSKCPQHYIYHKGYCRFTDVCETVRIDRLQKLEKLKNCRIVEGSIKIILLKKASEADWEQWSFPDLVEVTEFLLVYRVSGLKDLGKLFPNLAVIRGMKLVQQYSLVIYDTQLEDIGLHSLHAIMRGSVRIQNNINLCYIHTVNWNSIMMNNNNNNNNNVLTNNSELLCKDCCPSCGRGQSRDPHCPYCWSGTKDQQICSHCEHGCTAEGECCDEQCVGGCEAPHNVHACHACRNFNTGVRCVETCNNLLEYKGYRCVTKEYCKRMNFTMFNGKQCVGECPEGYKATWSKAKGMRTCAECESCEKSCEGLLVNTVARAQELRGCTTIRGPLIISIRYGKTVTSELESSLGAIRRVTHYVRLFKTSPLKSLNFLQNLTLIDGRQLYNHKYALFVHENANLEEVWDFRNHSKLNITMGSIFFHANPRLCYNKIDKLLNLTGQEEDFSMQLTNGNKVACSIMRHVITLVPVPFMGLVIVTWTQVSTNEDDRKITGYFIYYKETNDTNLGYVDGRDACNDDWKRKHAEVNDSNPRMEVELTHLKPSTHYAVYVETDTVADADIGARSNISYTTTMPYNPSRPLNLRVRDKGTTYIAVEWSPPSSPNGQIHHYIVSITHDMPTEDACQDFCGTEQIYSWKPEELEKATSEGVDNSTHPAPATPTPAPECCPCPAEPMPDFEEDEIEFIDSLQHQIILHRTHRRKRSLDSPDDASSYFDKCLDKLSLIATAAEYTAYPAGGLTGGASRSNITRHTFTGLSHYTHYRIEVSACHAPQDANCPDDALWCQLCSTSPAGILETTAKKDNASLVVDLRVEDLRQSSAVASWAPPVDPNGPVLAYLVSVSSGVDHTKILQRCVSSCASNKSQDKYHLSLDNLTPATPYLLRVEAYTRAPVAVSDQVSKVPFTTKAEDHGQMLLIIVIVLLLATICGIFVFMRVRIPKQPVEDDNPIYKDPDSVCSSIPRHHQLNPANLKLLEKSSLLGEGNFGIVFKGHLQQGCEWLPVAVKEAKDQPAKEDMLLEAKLMLELKSCHIVHAHGVVFGAEHTYLVMEYMGRGDLLKYLRQQKMSLETQQVCDMALQIADGMAYLASRNYVHRDLAARNCLIDDNMKIKISDLGMTRFTENNYYRIHHSKSFPVRWLAPECFTKHWFTTQSDVWSYAIVLWEILTRGRIPYEGDTNNEVREKVSNGHTLRSTVHLLTDRWLANLICRCWEAEGHDRPSFPKVISILLPHASPHFMQLFRFVSFYHQLKGQE